MAPTHEQWLQLLSMTEIVPHGMQMRHFLFLVLGVGDPFANYEKGNPLPGQVIDLVAEQMRRNPAL